jgi:ankyrin repeat protein
MNSTSSLLFVVMMMGAPQAPPSEILRAKYAGNEARVRELLAAGPTLNIFEAAATGGTDRVRELLKEDSALLNAYASDGFFPLALAAFFGHIETVRLLLDAGADVNQQSRETMKVAPLHSAIAARKIDIVKMLLARKADAGRAGGGGVTPLHEAAISGQIDMATLLIDSGAPINVRDERGKTPLAYAKDRRQEAMIAWLRGKGGV